MNSYETNDTDINSELSVLNTTNNETRLKELKDANWYLRKRYLVTALGFLGMVCMAILRSNLGVALVEMTSRKNITSKNQSQYIEPEFDWSSKDKGFLLSAFYYGYLLFAPFGGIISSKFGGATCFRNSMLANVILTLLTPYFSRMNYYFLIIIRILEGICQGFTFISFTEIFIYWAPRQERSRLIMFTYTGVSFGVAVNYSISSLSAQYFGWEWIFYVTAGISFIWCVAWTLLVANSPSEDRFITEAEKAYLKQEIYIEKKIEYPWKKILKCKPFWALVNEYFVKAWAYLFMQQSLPQYIKDVHDVSIAKVGLIASIPPVCSFLSNLITPIVADYIRSRQIMSISNVHKLFIGAGQIGCMIALIAAGLWSNFEGSILCFCIIKISFSFNETSYEVLPIDMFSQFASFTKGVCVSAYSIGSILNPVLIGYMTTNQTRAEWNQYFIFLTVFNLWGLIIFLLFGSGERQLWAN